MTAPDRGVAWELTPTTREFPAGVPDYVDADTRLYRLDPPVEVAGHTFEHVIVRFDRDSGYTEAYMTAHAWDFTRHGPSIERLCTGKGRAQYRKVMQLAGYEVKVRKRVSR